MKLVWTFEWYIPVMPANGIGASVAKGKKHFASDQAMQAFIKLFGDHCEAIGLTMWTSYTTTESAEVAT